MSPPGLGRSSSALAEIVVEVLAFCGLTSGAPSVTVFSGFTAAPFTDVRAELAGALTGPVRWRETMAAIAATGVEEFIDVGPDQVLAKLVTRNVEGARAIALEEQDGAGV